MKPRRFIGSVCLAVLCLLLTSCVDTKEPLSDPEKAKVDADLVGVWRTGEKDAGWEYCHVGRTGEKLPAGMMYVVKISHDEDGVVSRPEEQYLMFSTTIGKDRYLNIAGIEYGKLDLFFEEGWKPDRVGGYWLIKYRVEDDDLTIWFMDPEVKERIVKAGKIKGRLPKENTPAIFTDTTENVATLLAKPENADLFKNKECMTRYHRVK